VLRGHPAKPKGEKEALEALERRKREYAEIIGKKYEAILVEEPTESLAGWKKGLDKGRVWDAVSGGGLGIFLYGNRQQRRLLAGIVLGDRKRSFFSISQAEWDKLSDQIRTKSGKSGMAGKAGGVNLLIGGVATALQILGMSAKQSSWTAKDYTQAGNVVLSVLEPGFKLGQMIQPTSFVWKEGKYVGLRFGGSTASIQRFSKKWSGRLGKAGGIVGVVQSTVDLWTVYAKWRKGFSVDLGELLFISLNLGASLLMFAVPVVGTIVGTLVFIASSVYSLLSESATNGMLEWWFRSPWGFRSKDSDYEVISTKKPDELYALVVRKLGPFVEEVSEGLEDNPDRKDLLDSLESFLLGYLESNKKRGYRLDCFARVERTDYVVKFIYTEFGSY
jgi:hypothetical protein